AYDYRNQLVSFADNTLFQTGAYRYDCLGRRIERANNTGTVRYYYDGSRVIEEQTNNLTAATYVWGRPGDLLTMARAGTNYFYPCDDLGSVRAVTDNSGNRVETYAYSDFGLPSFFDGSGVPRANSAINNPWLFCSRQFDTESALTFWGDRYLDHASGRLI